MKTGIFGGTFNPIHLGHLRVAEEIREFFHLDRICLIPAAFPPHKPPCEISGSQRLEMIQLAISDNLGMAVSGVELEREGPSFTIDTVQHFKSGAGPRDRHFLIMGMDTFLEIDTWKSYRKLLGQIDLIVVSRPETPDRPEFDHFLSTRISGEYEFDPKLNCYRHPENRRIFSHKTTGLDISATRIRQLITEGRSIRFLVPEKVEAYIRTRRLYR